MGDGKFNQDSSIGVLCHNTELLVGLGELCSIMQSRTVCNAVNFIMLHMNYIMPAYNIIHDQRLPCG